jgi:hypothetical protein
MLPQLILVLQLYNIDTTCQPHSIDTPPFFDILPSNNEAPSVSQMDSGVQSPDMTGYQPTPEHAMIQYPHIPIRLQHPRAEFENRLTRVEQQQYQDGLTSHHRSVETLQSLQHLQQQLFQMQQAICYDIPTLHRQVEALQAKIDYKENVDCTRQIQFELRSEEQKVQSAMKNANLMRIYANASRGNTTLQQASLRGAEQMEALALSLRSRVYRGGPAYLSEAEDAEAWAAKLREDVKDVGQPEIDNKLLMDSKTATAPDDDISNANLEAEWTPKGLEGKWGCTSQTKSAPYSHGERTAYPAVQDSDLTQNAIHTTEDEAAPAQSVSAKSSTYVHIHTSQLSDSSGVTIKIESPSESSTSSAQAKAVPELKTEKVAPHLKYASQQIQASKDLTPEVEATINDSTTKTEKVATVAEAQVPSKTVPPHRRSHKRVTTPPTPESETKFTNHEIEESKPTGVTMPQPASDKPKREASPAQEKTISVKNELAPKSMRLPPHRRIVPAKPKAPELPQVDLPQVAKDDSLPSEGVKSDVFSREAVKNPEVRDTAKVEAEKSSPKPKDEVSSEKQDDSVSTLDLNKPAWQPSYLRELSLLSPEELEVISSSSEMHTFDRSFILNHLGGTRWLPSFYSIPSPELSLLPGRGYYLLEDTTEPLAPSIPGHHGSLITPILRLPCHSNPSTPKPESMLNAPLFLKRGDRYVYYGMYSHIRSDRLDLERCNALIPAYLKEHWATQLSSAKRPKWVTEALQQHLRPAPTYSRPSSSASENTVGNAMTAHHQALESWHRDTSILTSLLRPENIMEAFAAPDTGAAIPGSRFWCLGLKCEGWDKGFYDMMCREERNWEKQGRRDGEKEAKNQKEMLRMLGTRPVKW